MPLGSGQGEQGQTAPRPHPAADSFLLIRVCGDLLLALKPICSSDARSGSAAERLKEEAYLGCKFCSSAFGNRL